MGRTGVEVLLDSVIVIDHLNGLPDATAYLASKGAWAAVSVITRAEVLAGCAEGERAVAEELLDHFPTLVIDVPVADFAAQLRRESGWKLPDAFRAAVAQEHGLRLATRNIRDFLPDRYPVVIVPYASP